VAKEAIRISIAQRMIKKFRQQEFAIHCTWPCWICFYLLFIVPSPRAVKKKKSGRRPAFSWINFKQLTVAAALWMACLSRVRRFFYFLFIRFVLNIRRTYNKAKASVRQITFLTRKVSPPPEIGTPNSCCDTQPTIVLILMVK